MQQSAKRCGIPLPKHWPRHVRSAVVHVSLAKAPSALKLNSLHAIDLARSPGPWRR